MKHIKLFEQFDDDDPFGEDTKMGLLDLKLIKGRGLGELYIAENIGEVFFEFFDGHKQPFKIVDFNFNPEIKSTDIIKIYVKQGWARIPFYGLPQEIKNRLS